MSGRIAFQGELGAYSHQACQQARPDMQAYPCTTFEDVVELTRSGEVELGMLAVENSTYGRVADVHSLLPRAGLHIVDEAFVRVHVNLLGVPGAKLSDVKEAHGHVVILPQCAGFLKAHGIKGKVSSDNARAARWSNLRSIRARASRKDCRNSRAVRLRGEMSSTTCIRVRLPPNSSRSIEATPSIACEIPAKRSKVGVSICVSSSSMLRGLLR